MTVKPIEEPPSERIDFEQVRLHRDARGRLVLTLSPQATPVENVRVLRCFPWSLRARYVSIRDEKGNEQVLLTDLESIAPQTRQLVEQELAAQEFIPFITGIESVDDRFDVMIWNIQTDRGPIELQIKSRDDVRALDQRRVLVKDHAGGQFEIPDLSALDARSRRLVEDHMS